MKVEIKVPMAGESVVEAQIGRILKKSGEFVKVDEEILELETEKVNQVLYAPATGQLQLNVKTGETVKIGQVIGSVDSAVAAPASKAASPPPASKEQPAPKTPEPPKGMFSARISVDESLASPPPRETPAPRASIEPPVVPRTSEGRESREKMSKLRRVISEKLVQVKNQTAMLTTFNEVDMSAIISLREREQESFTKKYGVKLGFMSFFVKACSAALKEYPDINGRIDKDEIVFHHYVDISIAVSTEKGLMVPVLRNTDQMSSAEIEKKLKEYADKARSGKITIDDLQGGTFTITNGGVFGSMLSTPILNPPQSAILGMHNIVKRAVVVNDEIVIRPMMYLALSYDHRIVDGKESIGFLVHIKKNLEEPARLLLDL